MRRWHNIVHAWLFEGLDPEGQRKVVRELEAPLPDETAADVERDRLAVPAAVRLPRSRGTAALMASFGKARA